MVICTDTVCPSDRLQLDGRRVKRGVVRAGDGEAFQVAELAEEGGDRRRERPPSGDNVRVSLDNTSCSWTWGFPNLVRRVALALCSAVQSF